MKRIISFVLCLVLCFLLMSTPETTVSAAKSNSPPVVSDLKITTANKPKLLKLSWKLLTNADGYQIYRSTTGKSGTYERIATVRNKNTYVDKGLKSSSAYFYKVRAFSKQNKKNHIWSLCEDQPLYEDYNVLCKKEVQCYHQVPEEFL